MGWELHRRTGHSIYSVDLSTDRPAVLMTVQRSAAIAAQHLAQNVFGKVVFVGHSFGGLVAMEVSRIWAQYPHLYTSIACESVCTVSTPVPGSIAAGGMLLVLAWLPPLQDLLDDQYVRHIWEHAEAAGYTLLSVEGGADRVVPPTPRAGSGYVCIPGATHTSVLLPGHHLRETCSAIARVV
jgi:pimeloyl-ACP methyl ester carboxylesterase